MTHNEKLDHYEEDLALLVKRRCRKKTRRRGSGTVGGNKMSKENRSLSPMFCDMGGDHEILTWGNCLLDICGIGLGPSKYQANSKSTSSRSATV